MTMQRAIRVGMPLWLVVALVPSWSGAPPATDAQEIRSAFQSTSTEMTPASRAAVEKGIDWLISAMHGDGGVGPDLDRDPELGCTAMVGMALLAEGNTTHGGPHSRELRRVLHAVLNMVEFRPLPNESYENPLVRRKIGDHADLFIATLFLTQIYGEAPADQADIERMLRKLVNMISAAQGEDGTWGDDSWAPVLGTVLGWECLRGASSCGLRVHISAKRAGEALFKKLRDSGEDPRGMMHAFYKSASSIRVLHSMGYRDDPVFKKCVERILRVAHSESPLYTVAGGEEYLAFFFVTECMLQEPDEAWQAWYPEVSKRIVKVQNDDGSWSGHHCITGRTFCTAAALMTIQARNLCLPISEL